MRVRAESCDNCFPRGFPRTWKKFSGVEFTLSIQRSVLSTFTERKARYIGWVFAIPFVWTPGDIYHYFDLFLDDEKFFPIIFCCGRLLIQINCSFIFSTFIHEYLDAFFSIIEFVFRTIFCTKFFTDIVRLVIIILPQHQQLSYFWVQISHFILFFFHFSRWQNILRRYLYGCSILHIIFVQYIYPTWRKILSTPQKFSLDLFSSWVLDNFKLPFQCPSLKVKNQ